MTSVVDWIYYSFSPLSTLGYGDTIAAGRTSGMLAIGEAISGQLLLAVLIAFARYASGHTQHSWRLP